MDLAFETGLIRRKRLIEPSDILYAICMESTKGTVSYNDLAAKIESKCDVSVSRQAIWKKVTEPCKNFFKKVLELIILSKIDTGDVEILRYSNQFKRILIQDSTIIRLPLRLFEIFSGVANAHSKVCNARIQGVYDILAERFISFSIDPFSKNDLEAAPEICLQKDDLVLRDRGYLITDEIERHINNEAHCIFRHKHGMTLLDTTTGEPIDILARLEKENNLDIKVMLNNKDKTIVRITAAPVDEEIANIRRMKAKKEKKTPLLKNT
ncbi:hypothetical protein ES705_49490 [subsurface metagenome]